MAEFVHKPGQFSLFKNDKQGGNPGWPDYKGTGMDLDGNLIYVSAWIKESAKGKFMSCSFKLAGEKKSKPATVQDDPLDDGSEIPF